MKPEEKKEYIFPQMRVVVLKCQNKMMQCSPNGDNSTCVDKTFENVPECEGDCPLE